MSQFDDWDKEFGFTATEPVVDEPLFSEWDKEFGITAEPTEAVQTELPIPETAPIAESPYMPQIEPASSTTTAVEPPAELFEDIPKMQTDPESTQQVAEEVFAAEPGRFPEVEEKPRATVKGTLARTAAQTLSLAAHAPGFIVDVGQSIAEKAVPKIQSMLSGIDEQTKTSVEQFNKEYFPKMQEIKEKYREEYEKAKTDEEIREVQKKIITEVHNDRLESARYFARQRNVRFFEGLDEEKFLDAVNKMPAGKQYATEIADIAYNNPATKISKEILEKYPSPEEVFGGGVVETFKDSPVKGLQYVGLAGLENIGNLVLFAANAPAGLVTIGLGAAGERAKELSDQDISDSKRLLNASAYGLAESIPEMFGSAAIVGRLKDAFKTTAKELGKEAAEKGLLAVTGGMLKTGMKEWGVEFAEENITSLSQILTDVAMGIGEEDAKKRLSTYLTDEMPELAAATWTSGFLGAGRKAAEIKKAPELKPEIREEAVEEVKEKMLEEGGIITEKMQKEKRVPKPPDTKVIEAVERRKRK